MGPPVPPSGSAHDTYRQMICECLQDDFSRQYFSDAFFRSRGRGNYYKYGKCSKSSNTKKIIFSMFEILEINVQKKCDYNFRMTLWSFQCPKWVCMQIKRFAIYKMVI